MNLKQIDRAIAQERATIAKAHTAIAMAEARLVVFQELRRLHSVEQRSTVNGEPMENLTDTHRVNISAGRGGSDPFLAAIRAKGYTLRSLATKLGVSASMLSMNRRTHGVPKARAEAIEKLTGWPADRKHWPAGILS